MGLELNPQRTSATDKLHILKLFQLRVGKAKKLNGCFLGPSLSEKVLSRKGCDLSALPAGIWFLAFPSSAGNVPRVKDIDLGSDESSEHTKRLQQLCECGGEGHMEGFMCLTTAKALCLWYSHTSLSQLTPEWQALVKNTNSTDSQKYTFSYNIFISTTLLFTTLANLTLPPSFSWSSVTVATFMPLPRPFNSHAYRTNSCSTKLSRDSYIHTFWWNFMFLTPIALMSWMTLNMVQCLLDFLQRCEDYSDQMVYIVPRLPAGTS